MIFVAAFAHIGREHIATTPLAHDTRAPFDELVVNVNLSNSHGSTLLSCGAPAGRLAVSPAGRARGGEDRGIRSVVVVVVGIIATR